MKKWIGYLMDIIIGLVIGCVIVVFVSDQMKQKQSEAYELQKKTGEQLVTKAISTLQGDQDKIKSSQVKYPAENELYARIHNDERGFSKNLYYGDSNAVLDIAIGQSTLSGIPGEGRPLLIAGHNGTQFVKLQEFEVGDIVKIETSYGSYAYEVYDMEKINKYDFQESRLSDDSEYLMMYTCYPFNVITTDIRYFVYAKKISGPVIEEDGAWKK